MTDRFTVHSVVIFLGVIVLLGLGGLIWLISVHTEAAALTTVVGITTGALGGLTGVLASTRSAESPQAVVGPGGGPVPVVEGQP